MKVATIVPQKYLHLVENDNYLMCLAHLLAKPGMEEYTSFFWNQAQHPESFVIMDNGVIEGQPQPIDILLTKALAFGVNELVLPDVFLNMKATLAAISHATDYLIKYMNEEAPLSELPLRFMAVPQGNTLEEWIECARIIMENPFVDTIGIPKVLVKIAGRDGRLQALIDLNDQYQIRKQIHLLGCWTTPLEITVIAKAVQTQLIPEVRGVDSVLPYVFARKNLYINEDDRPDSDPIDFENGLLEKDDILRRNIMMWRNSGDIDPNRKVIYF